MTNLQNKIDRALRLLDAASKTAKKESNQPLEICYSGGKDSDVILELAKMAGVDHRTIYKNTTIDPPGTIKHCIEMGAEIFRPKESFRELLARRGWPSRRVRFCCSTLKEYKVLDYAVVGVRRDESWKRAKMYHEPEICRVYSAKSKARQYLPILDWTLIDVAEFIEKRGIRCASTYYDESGNFHPERRLGCLCCPLMYRKNRIKAFEMYPNMVKMYLKQGEIYRKTHKKFLNDVYEWFVCYLFTESIAEFEERFGASLFSARANCKKFLENYFKIDLNL